MTTSTKKIEQLEAVQAQIDELTDELKEAARKIRMKQFDIWEQLEKVRPESELEKIELKRTFDLLLRRVAQVKNIANWENIPGK